MAKLSTILKIGGEVSQLKSLDLRSKARTKAKKSCSNYGFKPYGGRANVGTMGSSVGDLGVRSCLVPKYFAKSTL